MALDKHYVLDALLRRNYLPTVRTETEELPPIITSESFKISVVERLLNEQNPRYGGDYPGYDSVEYKLTRFNGVSRALSIPHPRAYAQLASCIFENWEQFDYISDNLVSMIRPKRHDDKRLIIMNYESRIPKARRSLITSFGHRFIVHADIANFYPSVYSHSIPWALVGFSEAKTNRSNKDEWYNELDQAVRLNKRNETQGIAIGPATSNILAEIILASIDEQLQSEFTYTRFIDDYIAYCSTHEDALNFVMRLEDELRKFKLVLNTSKTEIHSLPRPLTDGWVGSLNRALPKKNDVSVYSVTDYLDHAIRLSKETPDGSVLKYAVKSLIKTLLRNDDEVNGFTLHQTIIYVLNLAFHHPILIPLVGDLFVKSVSVSGEFQYSKEIRSLTREFSRRRLSDATCWSLYYSSIYDVDIEQSIAERIIDSEDCLSLLFLYLSNDSNLRDNVVDFVDKRDRDDLYELDRLWILLYQMYFDGNAGTIYKEDETFDIMKSEGVNFISPPLSQIDVDVMTSDKILNMPMGQWLKENMPKGIGVKDPEYDESGRYVAFSDVIPFQLDEAA